MADAEGFPFIPGRYGQIEWHCDGVNCWSCQLPGQVVLAVYTDRPRVFEKLWAIPGVKRHQTGKTEMRAVFPLEALEQVAGVIRAHKKPGITSDAAKKIGSRTAFGGTSRAENPRSAHTPQVLERARLGPAEGAQRIFIQSPTDGHFSPPGDAFRVQEWSHLGLRASIEERATK